MNAIRMLSPEENIVIAEAGVILSNLHHAAEIEGRRFPLSLAAKDSATIGGLVSTNAGGTQVLRFGPMRSLVLGMEAVLPDGAIFDGLSALRKDNRGYDLRQLLTGAEGTLGVVTAAALRLVPAISQRVVVWAGLATPDDALRLLRLLEERLGDATEAFELVPQDALALVLHHIERARAPLSGVHKWHALIEAVLPEGAADLGPMVESALESAMEQGLIEDAAIAANEAQAEAFWMLRENISEAERLDGIAVKHDISVAVSSMPEFMMSAAPIVEAAFSGARVLAFGHLGDGNVHFNVRSPEGSDARLWFDANNVAVSRLVDDLVTEAGGSISAEHGIGQLKLAEFARLVDPARLYALRAIKQALDPAGHHESRQACAACVGTLGTIEPAGSSGTLRVPHLSGDRQWHRPPIRDCLYFLMSCSHFRAMCTAAGKPEPWTGRISSPGPMRFRSPWKNSFPPSAATRSSFRSGITRCRWRLWASTRA